MQSVNIVNHCSQSPTAHATWLGWHYIRSLHTTEYILLRKHQQPRLPSPISPVMTVEDNIRYSSCKWKHYPFLCSINPSQFHIRDSSFYPSYTCSHIKGTWWIRLQLPIAWRLFGQSTITRFMVCYWYICYWCASKFVY